MEDVNHGYGRFVGGVFEYAGRTIRMTEERTETSTVYDEYDEEGNPVGEPREVTVVIRTNGHIIGNPTDAQLRAAGYKPVVVEQRPEDPGGRGHWEKCAPVDGGETIAIGWTWVEDAPEAVVPRKFSKLRLYAVLTRMGLWEGLTQWMQTQTMDGMSVYTAFVLAQDLTEDNEMFAPYLKMAQNALGVSDDVVEQILSQSILEG